MIRDWWENNRGKVIASIVVFHVGLTVGLLIATRLGRNQTEVRT